MSKITGQGAIIHVIKIFAHKLSIEHAKKEQNTENEVTYSRYMLSTSQKFLKT